MQFSDTVVDEIRFNTAYQKKYNLILQTRTKTWEVPLSQKAILFVKLNIQKLGKTDATVITIL